MNHAMQMIVTTMLASLATASLIGLAAANDNGLAIKPPLGWRSW